MRGHGPWRDLGWQERCGSCVPLSALIDGKNGNGGQKSKEPYQQPLHTPKKGAEALEAAGSVRLKQQDIYSLLKE